MEQEERLTKNDELEKIQSLTCSVIPAKAGIQWFLKLSGCRIKFGMTVDVFRLMNFNEIKADLVANRLPQSGIIQLFTSSTI